MLKFLFSEILFSLNIPITDFFQVFIQFSYKYINIVDYRKKDVSSANNLTLDDKLSNKSLNKYETTMNLIQILA